jgi:HEAT repeat protein
VNVGERRRAAAVAGHRGDRTTAQRMVTDEEPSVRSIALSALARLGALDPATLDAALRDPVPAVRRRAAELAAERHDVDVVRLLDDPDDRVVETAAWACGERGRADDRALTRLSALAVAHHDALVREAAVAALGALGDESGLPAILAATTDKPAVRRRAVIALAGFEGPEVDAALARARQDRDVQVRQAGEDLEG